MTSVTLAPETVQTPVVVEVKVTGRPDDAVALTVIGVGLYARFDIVPKVIVWLAWLTVKP